MAFKRWRVKSLVGVCLLGAFGACVGTETGNPPFQGTVAFNSHSSNPAQTALGLTSAPVNVTAVWLSLGETDLLPAGTCEGGPAAGDAVVAPDLGTGDHGSPDAVSLQVELPGEDFCGLRLHLVRSEAAPDGAPAAVEGATLLLQATLKSGTKVTIRSEQELTLRLVAEGDNLLSPDSPQVLVGFDVASWLQSLNLEQVANQDGGVELEISARSHADLLTQFIGALSGGVHAYHDDAASGQVEAGAPVIADATLEP